MAPAAPIVLIALMVLTLLVIHVVDPLLLPLQRLHQYPAVLWVKLATVSMMNLLLAGELCLSHKHIIFLYIL